MYLYVIKKIYNLCKQSIKKSSLSYRDYIWLCCKRPAHYVNTHRKHSRVDEIGSELKAHHVSCAAYSRESRATVDVSL